MIKYVEVVKMCPRNCVNQMEGRSVNLVWLSAKNRKRISVRTSCVSCLPPKNFEGIAFTAAGGIKSGCGFTPNLLSRPQMVDVYLVYSSKYDMTGRFE